MLNLKSLPAPKVIEELSYEQIREDIEARYLDQFPDDPIEAERGGMPTRAHMRATLKAEGNLTAKMLQNMAHHSLMLQARVNDKAKSMLLQFATGTDLDALGALFGVDRPVLVPADPAATPPVAEVKEDDEDYRERIAESVHGRSVAGPPSAWRFHAKQSHPDLIEDAAVGSPAPGDVSVHVLPRLGKTISATVLSEMAEHLSGVRPLTSIPAQSEAEKITYDVTASIKILPGVVGADALDRALASLSDFTAKNRALGRDVTHSGLVSALFVEGVHSVDVTLPMENVVVEPHQYAEANEPTLSLGGVDE